MREIGDEQDNILHWSWSELLDTREWEYRRGHPRDDGNSE